MATDHVSATVTQTRFAPMVDLNVVKDHADAVRRCVEWDRVGVLFDEGPRAIIVVLVREKVVVSAVRFSLSVSDSVEAIEYYGGKSGEMDIRCLQGANIARDQLVDLEELTIVWRRAESQSAESSMGQLTEFFSRIEENVLRRAGRGGEISSTTRRQVLFESYGRCMFEGCGRDLTIDETTGRRGNYAYLAHNVAASERGSRGVLYLSGELADRPENVLLLCAAHHRLVDVVAVADYSAAKLSEMRRKFRRDAQVLLDGLSRIPIPAYCLVWPVHQQVISVPSAMHIAQALAPIGARLDGHPNVVGDNDEALRSADAEEIWRMMPKIIDRAADRIVMQTEGSSYRAALFAIGLMPALIALGAKLGNKCEITPMLRDRESGLWYWPAEEPRGEFYGIQGLENLSGNESEICLQLGLTARPRALEATSRAVGVQAVSVYAVEGLLGNGSLGHPIDGYVFRQRMQELLHELRDRHGVERIHVLPCASNAACVFFGQAFDRYHPELTVYDFEADGNLMVPRLRIWNRDNECVVEAIR